MRRVDDDAEFGDNDDDGTADAATAKSTSALLDDGQPKMASCCRSASLGATATPTPLLSPMPTIADVVDEFGCSMIFGTPLYTLFVLFFYVSLLYYFVIRFQGVSQQKYGAHQKNEAGTRCMTQSDWGDNIASIPRAAQDGARRRKTAQDGARRRKTAQNGAKRHKTVQDGAKSAISSRDQIGEGANPSPPF